jgi:hypothetical protein
LNPNLIALPDLGGTPEPAEAWSPQNAGYKITLDLN